MKTTNIIALCSWSIQLAMCYNTFKYFAPNVKTIASLGQSSRSLNNALENIRDKLVVPTEAICRAVEKTSSNRLTISDAALLSGLSLYESRQGLMALAALTGGDLEVTNEGNIIYSFPRNFRSILNQRSYGQKLKNIIKFVAPKLYYLLRISVGLFLFISIAISFTTIFVVINSSSSQSNDRDNDNRNRRNSPQIYFSFSDFYNIFDLVRYGSSRQNGYNGYKQLSLIESFFSFIFGDGDPNAEFSTHQAQEVAKLIQLRNGVVTSDELAIVLDCPYDYTQVGDSSSLVVNESWVLPALIRFNGEPVVDEDGQILYKFEEFTSNQSRMSSGGGSGGNHGADFKQTVPKYTATQETLVLQSKATQFNQQLAAVLGAVNVGGVFWLHRVLSNPLYLSSPSAAPYLMAVTKIYPFLALYALAYFAIPAVRYFRNQRINREISMRNERRWRWEQSTCHSVAFQRKFQSACQLAQKMKLENDSKSKTIIYSTKVEADN